MKKFLMILLALMMVLSFVACSDDDDDDGDDGDITTRTFEIYPAVGEYASPVDTTFDFRFKNHNGGYWQNLDASPVTPELILTNQLGGINTTNVTYVVVTGNALTAGALTNATIVSGDDMNLQAISLDGLEVAACGVGVTNTLTLTIEAPYTYYDSATNVVVATETLTATYGYVNSLAAVERTIYIKALAWTTEPGFWAHSSGDFSGITFVSNFTWGPDCYADPGNTEDIADNGTVNGDGYYTFTATAAGTQGLTLARNGAATDPDQTVDTSRNFNNDTAWYANVGPSTGGKCPVTWSETP